KPLMTSIHRMKKPAVIITAFLISGLASFPNETMNSAGTRAAVRTAPARSKSNGSVPERRVTEALDKLALQFEEVREPGNKSVKFTARASGMQIAIMPTEALMRLNSGTDPSAGPASRLSSASGELDARQCDAVRSETIPRREPAVLSMKLIGANRGARAVGENQLAAKTNYFVGNDAARWRTGLSNYERVTVNQIYRGVDVVYYGAGRQLEYDFKVAPGAGYKAIRVRFDGADRVAVNDSGELVIDTAEGALRQHRPFAYQFSNGVTRAVSCRYTIKRGTVAFAVEQYDARLPLVIDPVLSYATLLGEATLAQGIAVDSAGNTYVTGRSSDFAGKFPTTPGAAQEKAAGSADAFVTKFDPKGSRLIYSTYLGGKGFDAATSIAVDRDGNAYITGYTSSKDFPATAGSLQTTNPGDDLDKSAFILKLNAAGDAISYATYLCGSEPQDPGEVNILGVGTSIAVDSAGSAYVTGYTEARDFPTK